MATPRLAPGEHRDPVATAESHPRLSRRGRREGAPTKYRRDYPERLLQASREGLSITAFAGELEVCRETLWDWQRRYPAFDQAIRRAKAIRLASWERRAIAMADDPAGRGSASVTMIIFALKNCDAQEWREKTVVEHDISDRVAERLEAAGQRMLGELKVINAAPSEGADEGNDSALTSQALISHAKPSE